jgi:hypothetical protein
MIEAAETAQRFLVGHQRSDLDTNEMLLFALSCHRGHGGSSLQAFRGHEIGNPVGPMVGDRRHAKPADPRLF